MAVHQRGQQQRHVALTSSSSRAHSVQEPLLLWTLVGVLAGIVLGAALKPAALGPQVRTPSYVCAGCLQACLSTGLRLRIPACMAAGQLNAEANFQNVTLVCRP